MDEGRQPSSPGSGQLISVEGVDGAGKTTQVALLAGALTARAYRVVTVREPGGTAVGELARQVLLHSQAGAPLDPWAEALLFIAARAQLLTEVIRPALVSGAVVIADRFVDSTLAYQGAGRGLDEAALRECHRVACRDTWPDLTILLRLDAPTARSRRPHLFADRMEEVLDSAGGAVSAAFDRIAAADPRRVAVVDATRPADQVARDVLTAVLGRIAAPAR